MKKLTMLAGMLIGTSCMAQNYFVGMDYLNTKATSTTDITVNGTTTSTNNSDTSNTLNLKVGIDDISNGRAYIKLGNMYDGTKDNIEATYYSVSINYDYYISKYDKFTPYIGGGIGSGKYSWKSNTTGSNESGTGMDYSIRVGTTMTVNDKVKAEIGYNITQASATTNHTINGASVKNEADTLKGLYIGFSYKF